MTECIVNGGNPGAIVKYFFLISDSDNSPGHHKAAEIVCRAKQVLSLTKELLVDPQGDFKTHLRNEEHGHELVWTRAHEAEAVILSVNYTPDAGTAAAVWRQALAGLQHLRNQFTCPPEVLQGEVVVLVGIGEDNPLIEAAESVLSARLSLSAPTAWGVVRGIDTLGPFLVAIKPGCRQEAEQFISWETFGHALYSLTKAIAQWKEYLDNEPELKQLVATTSELAHSIEINATHPVQDFHAHLKRLLEIGRNVNKAVRLVSGANVSIKKNRTNLQQGLRSAFEDGLVTAMENDLLEYEGLLSAEASLLHEQWAELDRLTRQSLGEMQLESSRRTETLLAAAHLVEFFLVFYYGLGAWAHVVGEQRFEEIPWYGKLLWGVAVSIGTVFATYRSLEKGQHKQAVLIMAAVLIAAVVLALLLHWWSFPVCPGLQQL